MNILIDNFGPIKHYRFDLSKDLHLILGTNNIGKSYSITIAYVVVKTFLQFGDLYFYRSLRHSKEDNKEASFSIDDDEDTVMNKISQRLSQHFAGIMLGSLQNSFVATFDSLANLQNQFTDDLLRITIDSDLLAITLRIKDSQLNIESLVIKRKIQVRPIRQNRIPKVNNTTIILYHIANSQESYSSHCEQLAWELLFRLISEVTDNIRSVHYLPASRSGLYQALSAFGQIIAELSKSRAFIKKRIELPNIPEPLSDYFISLSDIADSRRGGFSSELDDIAKDIEKDILKGRVDFDTKTKRIIFSPDNTRLRLDLSSTSSMVSELSPIVSFIRYILAATEKRPRYSSRQNMNAKPLVIIEEPEAHLHPEVQVKIMEIFARLVDKDVKVIVTTHSNYIFNKCNNLILSGHIKTAKLHAAVFEKGEQGSVGRVVQTDQLGMDDENFVPTTESLYDEKLELINTLNRNVR